MTQALGLPFRLLLVEPDDAACAYLLPLLTAHGASVDRVREGLQGFVRVQDEPYDAVWVAWHGVDVDGATVCSMIRSWERRSEEVSRFVLLLGREADREELVAATECGADDYLVGSWSSAEIAWKLRLAREVMVLRRIAHTHEDRGGLLSVQELRAFVAEEVNRVGRRSGWLSLAVLGIPALSGLQVSYGKAWTTWFASGVWASVRGRLRNYDRMGTLENGTVCLVAPDLDMTGMSRLLERLSRMVAEYHVAGADAALPLTLAARALSVRIKASYAEFGSVADSLWGWLEEQAALPVSEGVLAFVGAADPLFHVALAVEGVE
jgi:DNA-binding response OmpR family regulator